jgi:tetratricopeptide (TPR) repeat protein
MGPFVGRQLELEVLRTRLAMATSGQPQVVQIEGPAGIGKTALVERFLAGADPVPAVLRASGEETEELLANGVLEQLARSAGAPGAALAADLAARATGPVPDPVSVGVRLLGVLDALAGRPVVLVVDDLHWADLPSRQALIFVLRRLVADPVLALLAVRDEAVAGMPESLRRLVTGHRGSALRLRGLDEQDLRELADRLGVAGFGPGAARRLRYSTQGNPLHARALLEEVPAERWVREPDPLPSPRSFRLLVQDRLAGCSGATRALVEAAAVLRPHCPLPLAVALAGIDDGVHAVDEAARHDLLQPDEGTASWTLSFSHPLVRAAVRDAMGPARRQALHAAAVDLEPDEVEALRHRVAATTQPDPALAADLTRLADAEADRQAWQSAATHLLEARRVSPADEQAERRVLLAVVWTLLRGDAATAATFSGEVAAFAPGPLRDAVLGALATAADDPQRAAALLDRAWAGADPDRDPEVAAIVATTTAVHRYGRLDAAGTVDWCSRALALTSPGTAIHAVAQTYLLHGMGYAGDAAGVAAAAPAAEDRGDDLWLNPRSARGTLRLVDDDLVGARADLSSTATAAAHRGILNTAAFAFAYLARAEWVAGDWDSALVHAERAVAINLESDFGFMHSAVVGIAVLVPAARGEWATAEARLQMIAARANGYERSVVAMGMSRARIGEARGDPGAVLAALEPVTRFEYGDAVDEPGFWAWQDLYADALVATGRAAEADRLLVPHEERAAQRHRATAVARLARARGAVEAALGHPDRADRAFAHALEACADLPAPFERARVELAAGRALRRAGRRRRAATLLAAAEDRFTALGAGPYAERCAAELTASGLRPTARRDRDPTGLTRRNGWSRPWPPGAAPTARWPTNWW